MDHFLKLILDQYAEGDMFGVAASQVLASCASLIFSEAVETWSLEERVGQVIMAHFHGEEANEEARQLIEEGKIGGIIYYNWSNGLTSPEQVRHLSVSLQTQARQTGRGVPLWIAVDQEGGRVARLKEGFTEFPSNGALGATGCPELAEEVALAMGKEMRAVEINMDFAPVIDVNISSTHGVLKSRTYGNTAEEVTVFGKRAIAGFKKAGVIPTLKHFPGHGEAEVDSHKDLPKVSQSLEALEAKALYPFKMLASEVDVVMTAHLWVPALDPENCSTMSEKTLRYLRDVCQFKGVIITDSLVMQGVLKQSQTVDEAAIRALKAGCDILLLGGKDLISEGEGLELKVSDVLRIRDALVSAVRSGRVPEERLNEAVKRVLQLKERYFKKHGLAFKEKGNLSLKCGISEHRALAKRVEQLALGEIAKTTH